MEDTENHSPEYKISVPSKITDAATDIYYTEPDPKIYGWFMMDRHEFVNNTKGPLHPTPIKSDDNGQKVENWIVFYR